MHDTSLIALLVVGFVLAFAFGTIAQRLRLSPLVGYLLAGVVAGPFTMGFVEYDGIATQLAEVGVMLLMFGVGLHFSFDDLLSVRKIALPGAVLEMTAVAGIGTLLGHYVLGYDLAAGVVFGLCLSVASTVVLMRSLEERRMLDTSTGRIAVGWLVVEDIAMVLALVLLPALAGPLKGEEGVSLWPVLLATLAKVGAFMAVMLIVGRRVIPWILERVAHTGSRELFTLCVLAIALGVAFASAELFGVSLALGAFFAGMILSESEFSAQAATETLPLRDAFAVLFFVSVGMLFDPMILLERPLQVLATFAVIVVGKSLTAFAIVRLFGKPDYMARTIAASLAQIGEFSFVLAALGLSLGLLPVEARDLILAGSLLSITLNPLLFVVLDRIEAKRRAAEPVATERLQPPLPDGAEAHVLLVGYGRVGSELGPLLAERGVPVVVIDDDQDLVVQARAAGLPAVRGHAANPLVLAEAEPARAQMALLAIPNAFEAGEIIDRLRELNPGISIMARAHSEAGVRYLIERGADGAVLAERELAHSLAEMVLAMPVYRGGRSLPPAAPG